MRLSKKFRETRRKIFDTIPECRFFGDSDGPPSKIVIYLLANVNSKRKEEISKIAKECGYDVVEIRTPIIQVLFYGNTQEWGKEQREKIDEAIGSLEQTVRNVSDESIEIKPSMVWRSKKEEQFEECSSCKICEINSKGGGKCKK